MSSEVYVMIVKGTSPTFYQFVFCFTSVINGLLSARWFYQFVLNVLPV